VPERADESGSAPSAALSSPSAQQFEPYRTSRKEPGSSRRSVDEPEVEVEYEVRDPSYQHPVRSRKLPSYLKDYACRVVYRQRC